MFSLGRFNTSWKNIQSEWEDVFIYLTTTTKFRDNSFARARAHIRPQSDASCTEFYWLIIYWQHSAPNEWNNFVDMLFVWQFSPFTQIARSFFLSFVVDFLVSQKIRNNEMWNEAIIWNSEQTWYYYPNEPGNTFAFMNMIVFSVIYCSRIYCKFSALYLFDFPFAFCLFFSFSFACSFFSCRQN